MIIANAIIEIIIDILAGIITYITSLALLRSRYYMESMRHKEKEELVVAYLDTKCQMIKDMMITSGTINQSLFSIREIFVQALRLNAVNIVIVHNHPSGNSEPSKDDIISTKKICEAGQLIGITVLDHIIIGDKSFTSLNALGII